MRPHGRVVRVDGRAVGTYPLEVDDGIVLQARGVDRVEGFDELPR